jgi:hypothetical protein
MSKVKSQHFVPQFVLKNFQGSSGARIYVDGKKIPNRAISISSTFQKKYLYDYNNEIESFLGEYVEGPSSSVIKGLLSGDEQSLQREGLVKRFLGTQLYRTTAARAEAMAVSEEIAKQKKGILTSFPGMTVKYDSFTGVENFDEREIIQGNTLLGSVYGECVLKDLELLVLEATAPYPFFISDNPAFHYNWFLKGRKHCFTHWLMGQGAVVFMPFSPTQGIFLFDSKTYRPINSKRVQLTRQDILGLNKFQFMNRLNSIVYSGEEFSSTVSKLARDIPAKSFWSDQGQINYIKSNEGGHHFSIDRQRLYPETKWAPSFLKVRRNVRKSSSVFDRESEHINHFKEVWLSRIYGGKA